MDTLLYSALDLAAIISSMELGCREESHVIDLIWDGEKTFLLSHYQTNKKKFILDIHYWMHYFYEKPVLDREFPAIQKDLQNGQHAVDMNQYMSDYSDLDLFFKSVRIRILYGSGKDYVRIKLRSLISQYGYQRRSQQLVEHIRDCMQFYHLEATLRGGIPCDIATCDLDKMVTFRVV